MKRLSLALAVSLLAGTGCAMHDSTNTVAATDMLTHEYAGHKIDEFFLSYGKSSGKPVPTANGTTYHWVSIEPTLDQPLSGGYHGSPAIVQAESGNISELYCELNIHTTNGGIIRNFTVLSDSQGKYTTSYCNDIFISPATHKGL